MLVLGGGTWGLYESLCTIFFSIYLVCMCVNCKHIYIEYVCISEIFVFVISLWCHYLKYYKKTLWMFGLVQFILAIFTDKIIMLLYFTEI